MTQVNTNLNNTFGLGLGVTPHYAITYDDSLSAADGQDRANALMAVCDGDYTWMDNVFGGIALVFSLPLSLQITPGAYAGAGWGPGKTPIALTPGNGSKLDLVRYLVVSEVTEMFMQTKDNGWGYSFGDGKRGQQGRRAIAFPRLRLPILKRAGHLRSHQRWLNVFCFQFLAVQQHTDRLRQ